MKNIFVSSGIFSPGISLQEYRKIPKISPGAYIFQRPFLRGLFLEGLIFGGAYLRREICVSKSIGLACSGKEIYHFCFVLLCIREQIPCTSPRGANIRRGDVTEDFLRYDFEGLIHGGAYFRNFTVFFPVCRIFFLKSPSKVKRSGPKPPKLKNLPKQLG